MGKFSLSNFNLIARLKDSERYQAIRDAVEQFRGAGISAQLQYARYLIENWIDSQPLDEKARGYFLNRNEDGPPYQYDEIEPKQVCQLKKIVNALALGEAAVDELETIKIDASALQRLPVLFEQISESVRLATLLEVDLSFLINEQRQIFRPLTQKFSVLSESHQIKADALIETISKNSTARIIGEGTGQILDSLKSSNDSETSFKDRDLLLKFNGWISNTLDLIAEHLIKKTEQPESINAIKHDAEAIIKDIRNIYNEGISFTKLLRQIKSLFIIKKKLYDLCYQGGVLNEEIQLVLIDWLEQLQGKWTPKLFDLAHRIEQGAMLESGTYANKILKTLADNFDYYYPYVSALMPNNAEFNDRASTLVNYHFVEQAIKYPLQRIRDYEEKNSRVQIAARVWDKTWAVECIEKRELNQDESELCITNKYGKRKYQNRFIKYMSQEEQKDFLREYRHCQPYVRAVSADLDARIVELLKEKGNNSGTLWPLLASTVCTGELDELLALSERVKNKIRKEYLNNKFQIHLNRQQIKNCYASLELSRGFNCPISKARTSIVKPQFKVDDLEKTLKNLIRHEVDAGTLTWSLKASSFEDKCFEILGETSLRQLCLKRAMNAYVKFQSILEDEISARISSLTEKKRKVLAELYYQFRFFFLERMFSDRREKFDCLDEDICSELNRTSSSNTARVSQLALTRLLIDNEEVIRQFKEAKSELDGFYWQALNSIEEIERNRKKSILTLQMPIENCIRHKVLKTSQLSTSISIFKFQLFNYMSFFSKQMQELLKPYDRGVPFPEVEDVLQEKKEARQFKAIKRLYNCIYYLEQIACLFEGLDERAWLKDRGIVPNQSLWQIGYFHNSIFIYVYYAKLKSNFAELIFDPHFSLYLKDARDKLNEISQNLLGFSKPYLIDSEQISQDISISSDGLFILINALYFAPTHIKSFNYNFPIKDLEQTEINARAKALTHHYEWVIELIKKRPFLGCIFASPKIYNLYKSTATQLYSLKEVGYEIAVTRLREIRRIFISSALFFVDDHEDKLGLSASFSDEVSLCLVEFFDGVIEQLNLFPDDEFNICSDDSWLDERLLVVERENEKNDRFKELKTVEANSLSRYQELISKVVLMKKGGFFDKEILSEISVFCIEYQQRLQRFDVEITKEFIEEVFGEFYLSFPRKPKEENTKISILLSPNDFENRPNLYSGTEQIRILPLKKIKKAQLNKLGITHKLNKILASVECLNAQINGDLLSFDLRKKLLNGKREHLLEFKNIINEKNCSKKSMLVRNGFSEVCRQFVLKSQGIPAEKKNEAESAFIRELKHNRDMICCKAERSHSPYQFLVNVIGSYYKVFKDKEEVAYLTLRKVETLTRNVEKWVESLESDSGAIGPNGRQQSLSAKKSALRKLNYILSLSKSERASSVILRLHRALHHEGLMSYEKLEPNLAHNKYIKFYLQLKYFVYNSLSLPVIQSEGLKERFCLATNEYFQQLNELDWDDGENKQIKQRVILDRKLPFKL